MARTRWQRRRAIATTGDRLRALAVGAAVALVGLDIVLSGIVPVGLLVLAGTYVFIEGCFRASVLVAQYVLG